MRSRATLVLLAAVGSSWTVGQAVLPDMGLQTDKRYDAVAAHRGLGALSTSLLIIAGCLLVLGAMSVMHAVDRRDGGALRGARLVRIGAACLALGGVWLVAGRGAFNLLFLRATSADVSRESGIAVLDAPVALEFLPLVLTLPALLLGPVLLGVGLHRAQLASWAPLVLWVVGIGLFLGTEFTVKAGEVVGVGIGAVALAMIGRSVTVAEPFRHALPRSTAR